MRVHPPWQESMSSNPQSIETAKAYSVAGSKIVWQCFEEEVVVINLESGNYYSLNPTATAIWNLVAAGGTISSVVDDVCKGAPTEEQWEQVLGFCGRLIAEGLIRPGEAGDAPRAGALPEPARAAAGVWVAPTLTVYADMQDLFQLDPIHDVDETGWPSRPAEET